MSYARLPVHDEYAAGGRRAVFVDSQVIVLSDLGDAVLELLDEGPATEQAIAERLRATFGEPPEGDLIALTRACLDTLRESRLIERLP